MFKLLIVRLLHLNAYDYFQYKDEQLQCVIVEIVHLPIIGHGKQLVFLYKN